MRTRVLLAAALFVVPLAAPATAATYSVAVDVPSTLGGTDYLPSQVVRNTNDAYSLETSLQSDVPIGALHKLPGGAWLFAPRVPVTLNGTDYEPRDVVRWDGTMYSSYFAGSAAGVPADARIDALCIAADGRLVLSFDVPVTFGGTDYGPSDLVAYGTSFATYWNARGAGVPETTNLNGAALSGGGQLIVGFDVPTTLGGVTYLAGDLVTWTGSAFKLFARDPAWPESSMLRDFALASTAGAVPDGKNAPGTELTVMKVAGSQISLSWGASCSTADTDYEVYEGSVGVFTSHAPRLCSTSGAKTATLSPGTGNRYYLVVPRQTAIEGSYGVDSGGSERPASASACFPRQIGSCH